MWHQYIVKQTTTMPAANKAKMNDASVRANGRGEDPSTPENKQDDIGNNPTRSERSRARRKVIAEAEERARKGEEAKQARIAKEKEDNRLKREEAAMNKKKESEAAEMLEESMDDEPPNASMSTPAADDRSNRGGQQEEGKRE